MVVGIGKGERSAVGGQTEHQLIQRGSFRGPVFNRPILKINAFNMQRFLESRPTQQVLNLRKNDVMNACL